MMANHILGILGGMGPQASAKFYQTLIDICLHDYKIERNGDFPHILLDNIPVPDLVRSKKDEEFTSNMVADEALRLKNAGATMLAMPCNTMHLYADMIEEKSGLSLVSMVDAVVEKVAADGLRKVGLIGTQTTMKSRLYLDPLEAKGIQAILPNEEDQETVGQLIHAVIAGKIFVRETESFLEIVDRLRKEGAEGIILGCTELPFLLPFVSEDSSLPLYDSPAILAKEVCKQLFQS